jgi:hypothetical protein
MFIGKASQIFQLHMINNKAFKNGKMISVLKHTLKDKVSCKFASKWLF